MVDIIKYIIGVLLLAGGIIAFNYFHEYPMVVRVLGIILVFITAGLVFVTTTKGKNVWVLFGEARQEIRKVIWPAPNETHKTTAIVIVAVFIVGLILWAIDSMLVVGIRWFTGN